jgi:hypothetical protein
MKNIYEDVAITAGSVITLKPKMNKTIGGAGTE